MRQGLQWHGLYVRLNYFVMSMAAEFSRSKSLYYTLMKQSK